jgi:hypothetical protein
MSQDTIEKAATYRYLTILRGWNVIGSLIGIILYIELVCGANPCDEAMGFMFAIPIIIFLVIGTNESNQKYVDSIPKSPKQLLKIKKRSNEKIRSSKSIAIIILGPPAILFGPALLMLLPALLTLPFR